jgi:hypothetical protein
MAQIKLNRKLNLVLDIDVDVGKIYVHSVPISREVFEDNFLVISRAFTAVYTNGLGPVTGPRVAALLVKQEAQALNVWDKTKQSLFAEIHRLTSVMVPTDTGWDTIPFSVACSRGIIDEDVASEVENSLVYFTCASSIHLKTEMGIALEGLSTLWGALTTSLNATDFMRSLQTSTQGETTGVKSGNGNQ